MCLDAKFYQEGRHIKSDAEKHLEAKLQLFQRLLLTGNIKDGEAYIKTYKAWQKIKIARIF